MPANGRQHCPPGTYATAAETLWPGTRLAFDDAIALARAFQQDVPSWLKDFEKARKPVVEKLVAAANRSSYWYETFPERMKQDPWRLAYDYMTRSGRMSDERLQAEAPRFFEAVKRRLSPG